MNRQMRDFDKISHLGASKRAAIYHHAGSAHRLAGHGELTKLLRLEARMATGAARP